MADFDEIPVVDLVRAADGDTDALMDACSRVGVFYVEVGSLARRIPGLRETLAGALDETAAFFEGPQGEKDKIGFNDSPFWRGYAACGEEMTMGKPDMREQIDFAWPESFNEREEMPEYAVICGPNQWPNPSLKQSIEAYDLAMREIAGFLIQALSIGLEQEGSERGVSELQRMFNSQEKTPYSRMKIVRYPQDQQVRSQFPQGRFGVGPHKDHQFFGFLLQGPSQEAVLEAQNMAGKWIKVPNKKDTLVCSLGELFEVAVGGILKATTHRVRIPTKQARLSVNWFFAPQLGHYQNALGIKPAIRARWQANVDQVHFEGKQGNVIHSCCGENLLKGLVRSHPIVSKKFHPNLWDKYGDAKAGSSTGKSNL